MRIYFCQIKDALNILNFDEFQELVRNDGRINKNYWAYRYTNDVDCDYDSWIDGGKVFSSFEEAAKDAENVMFNALIDTESLDCVIEYQCFGCSKQCTVQLLDGEEPPTNCKYYLHKAEWARMK